MPEQHVLPRSARPPPQSAIVVLHHERSRHRTEVGHRLDAPVRPQAFLAVSEPRCPFCDRPKKGTGKVVREKRHAVRNRPRYSRWKPSNRKKVPSITAERFMTAVSPCKKTIRHPQSAIPNPPLQFSRTLPPGPHAIDSCLRARTGTVTPLPDRVDRHRSGTGKRVREAPGPAHAAPPPHADQPLSSIIAHKVDAQVKHPAPDAVVLVVSQVERRRVPLRTCVCGNQAN